MLTTLMKQNFADSFADNGYVVGENIIPPDLANDLLREGREIESTVPVEEPLIINGAYSGDEWFTCVSEYPAFRKLARAPFLVDRVEAILKSPCEPEPVFWSLFRIHPGQGNTLWHQDTDVLYTNPKIGVGLYLFGSEGGSTQQKVVPKSTGWPFPTQEQMHVSHPEEVTIEMSGQTAIFQSPLLWHTSVLNSSSESQLLLFLFYKDAEKS